MGASEEAELLGAHSLILVNIAKHFQRFVQPVMWESLGSLGLPVFIYLIFFAHLVFCGGTWPSLVNPLQWDQLFIVKVYPYYSMNLL